MTSPNSEPAAQEPWAPEFTGADSPISCLDCQRPLRFAMVASIKVACCDHCQGMLIQRDNLGPIVNRCRNAWRKLEVDVSPLDPSLLSIKTACPVCDQKMETHPYSGPGCIVIDTCQECDLAWLDGGELDRIIQARGKRSYEPGDLESNEISFVKPLDASVDPTEVKPATMEDEFFSTLVDLIHVLGI